MSSRYTPVGNWRPDPEPEDIMVWGADRRFRQYVTREVCDLRESNGHIWKDGAWKVTITKPNGRDVYWHGKLIRSKTFKGESAWCQSRSYAEDAVRAVRLAAEAL